MRAWKYLPAQPRLIVDLPLLAVALIGACNAYPASQRYQAVAAEYRRLENLVGDLSITDPTKVVIRAIETGQPLHFAWRIYLPANYHASWRSPGGGSSSFTVEPRDFTARVRLRRDEHGRLMLYVKSHDGSGLMSINHPIFSKLSDEQLQQLEVNQFGRDGLQVVEPDAIVNLLVLSLPPELHEQLRDEPIDQRLSPELPVLWRWQLGPKAKLEDAS